MIDKQAHTHTLSFADIDVPDTEIFSYMGYGTHTPRPEFIELTHELKSQLIDLCKPIFGYIHLDGKATGRQEITLERDKVFHPGRIITRYLEEADSFIILVASAGREFDAWLKSIHDQGDVLLTFIADALGSTIAEATVAYALNHLEQHFASRKLHISNSYSPGYCGWHVKEQQILFSLLPPNFCGVTLTDSSLMLPIKSVSALIGVSPTIERKPYGCAICRKLDCYKRRL